MSDYNKKLTDFMEEATKLVQNSSHRMLTRLDKEREKAKMRSDIGNNKKELTKAYEDLGRAYYAIQEKGDEVDTKELFDQIRAKEKVIELLNEKLKTITEESL